MVFSLSPLGTHEEQSQGTEGNLCGQGSSICRRGAMSCLGCLFALALPPQDVSTQKGKSLDAQVL